MVKADLSTLICRLNKPLAECTLLMWARNPYWEDTLLDLCINTQFKPHLLASSCVIM